MERVIRIIAMWTISPIVVGLVLMTSRVPIAMSAEPVRAQRVTPTMATLSAKTAASTAAVEEHVEEKSVTGQVSGVTTTFIAVEYQHDAAKGSSAEMAFPIDLAVQFQLKATLKALKLGDTVAVEYREVTHKGPDGKVTGVQRMATKVTFVATAAPPETPQASVPTTAGQ